MNTLKKMSALLLALMLTLSMCMVSVSAATTDETASVVYVKPNSNWLKDNARFAMYLFNSTGNQWIDMADEDGDGYYEAEMPAGSWTVIFCRMNPNATANNWSNKWNQTSNLTIPDGSNCYLVKDGTWDKGGGEWTYYTPGVEPSTAETEPTTAPSYKYTVAGDAGLCGVAWEPASEANALTDEDGDGVYEITYTDVPAGSYSFKVTDGTWNNSWGGASGNYSINLSSASDVTIKFTETTKEIEVVSAGLGEFILNHMTVVGDLGLVGANWDPTAKEGVMTQDENGVWTITFTNVAAGTYEYKFVANDAYTYNWTVEGYFNSLLNSTLVVENEGADVTLTIDVSGFDFSTSEGSATASASVTGGTPTEPVTDPSEPVTDPSEPVTDPTEPVEEGYYLFGSINGANYGCDSDWQTIGEYRFVDGKLTVEFTEISYVGVKTSDNGSWFMTDGWQGIVKTVTLYNTTTLGEDANKLIVPQGKVEFTLTENADGTLTLSYVSENEPVIPTEPVTDPTEPVTDPTEPVTDPTEPVTDPSEPVTEPTTAPSDTVTVYFAAPRVAPGRTVWSDVDIYYNNTTSVIKSNRIHMTDTGLVVDNPSGASLKTTRRGNWHVFSAELTADQVAAIDSAKYAGFVYAGNYNLKTSAKFDIKMGGSIADFDGQVFLINGAVTNSEVDSYTGEWTTAELVAPEYKATTLKFACPTQNWSGGVYFYYGDSSVITTVTKLEMTDSGKTLTVDDSLVSALTKYVGGEWKVYTLELTAEQVEIIDNSSVSGFCSGSSIYVKTSSARNVFRDYNSVQDLENYAFVATNCTNAAQERASLTGKWRWCKL